MERGRNGSDDVYPEVLKMCNRQLGIGVPLTFKKKFGEDLWLHIMAGMLDLGERGRLVRDIEPGGGKSKKEMIKLTREEANQWARRALDFLARPDDYANFGDALGEELNNLLSGKNKRWTPFKG